MLMAALWLQPLIRRSYYAIAELQWGDGTNIKTLNSTGIPPRWNVVSGKMELSVEDFNNKLIISPAVASLLSIWTFVVNMSVFWHRFHLRLPTVYVKTQLGLAEFGLTVSQLHAYRYSPWAVLLVERQIGSRGKVNPDLSWSALRLRVIRLPLEEQSVRSVPTPMRALRMHSSPVL